MRTLALGMLMLTLALTGCEVFDPPQSHGDNVPAEGDSCGDDGHGVFEENKSGDLVCLASRNEIHAGDVIVLVADPAEAGMDALLTGRIETVGNCLGVAGQVVIWHDGTEVKNDDPLVIQVPHYGTFQLGDSIEIGGGAVRDVESEAGVVPPESCQSKFYWVAN